MKKEINKLFEKALKYFENKQYEKAADIYDKIIILCPNNFEAHNNKGIALSILGREEESVKCFDIAIKINPDFAEAYNNKGTDLSRLGKNTEALKCFATALKINPDFAEAYNNKGIALSNLERNKEAIKCYNKTIKINPNFAEAYTNKGIALINFGKNEEVLGCFDSALAISPNFAEAYNGKGIALSNLERNKEAIKCYNKAIKINPNFAEAYYNKGTALDDWERNEKSIKCFEKAVQINPDFAEAHYNKGIILYRLARYKEAVKCFEKATEINPDFVEAHDGKGTAFGRLKKNREALKCFDRAVEINPDFAEAYHNKGVSLYDLGRNEEAVGCFEKTVSISIKNAQYTSYLLLYLFYRIYKKGCSLIDEKKFDNYVLQIIENDFSIKEEYEEIKSNGNKLYNYTKINENTLRSVFNNELWLSNPTLFNDPCDPSVKLFKDKEGYEYFDKIISKIKIGCLAITPLNILMWGHYANKHEGMCIEYDISSLLEENAALKKVVYEKKLLFDEGIVLFNDRYEAQTNFIDLFIRKHEDWKYENEYRVLYYDENDSDKNYNGVTVNLKITGVYFGMKVKKENKDFIMDILKDNKNIKFYDVSPKEDNMFEFEYKKL